MRYFVNYTLSNLVIYILRYIPASRAFPKAKYSVICTEIPMSSKFYFSKWKIDFSLFTFSEKYLEYYIH